MLAVLVIVFRETIEAGLIIGIVLAVTRGLAGRNRWVGTGIAGGLAGAGLVAAFAGEIGSAFMGAGQDLFNAAVLAIAVAMLAWHNIWMTLHGRTMAQELKQIGSDVAAGRRPLTALAVVIGVAVLREGSESVLFVYSIIASGGTSAGAIALAALLGVAGAGALAGMLYRGLISIPMRRLFTVTSTLVTLLAAGLASQAIAFLQQAGYAEVLTTTAWDTSWLLSDDSIVGRMLHTLIGYTAAPSGLQVGVYGLTIAMMVGLMRLINGATNRAVAH